MTEAIAIIPARYASERLPGKPLLDATGKPLVIHVADQAAKASSLQQVVIATDDQRIADAAQAHDYRAVMTGAEHPNGTSRLAEAAELLETDAQIIVNVQGDEPWIDPTHIDLVIERMANGDEPMATLASPFGADEDPADTNIVKVVVSRSGRALYFSRALIPFDRRGSGEAPPLKHLGLYAYRRDFLPRYVAMAPAPAEQAECLEQLRALENDCPIAVVTARVAHHGIDTPEQYEAFVAEWSARGRA